MKKPRKTRYCIHYHNCDREEDCMEGQYCPIFESNPAIFTKVEEVEIETVDDVMNNIWEGK